MGQIKKPNPMIKFTQRIVIFLLLCALVLLNVVANGQSIKRQVVASMASTTSQTSGITFTVGQPYGTNTYYDTDLGFMPGFQQATEGNQQKNKIGNLTFNSRVYPNPANEKFSIDPESDKEIVDVAVSNLSGQLIYEWKGGSLSNNSINSSNWPSGMYILIIQDESGNASTSKINIQH